jgi:AAA+ superfamily predicted ATPase
MNTKELLVGYIRAGYPAVWMQTAEEARAERIIELAAKAIGDVPDQEPMPVYKWSFTQGWHGVSNGLAGQAVAKPDEALQGADPNTTGPHVPANSVVVLKDYHSFFEDVGILRAFRDLLATCKETGTFIVILSPVLNVKPEIEKDVLILDLPLPEADELGEVLDGIIKANAKLAKQGEKLYGVPRESILDGLAGLTLLEAENVLSLTIIRHGALDGAALKSIHREKAHVLKKGGLLRYKESDRGVDDVGGLDALKAWFKDRMVGYTKEAREAGLQPPKGCLLVGVQGCGKSLAAEAVANLYKVPLIEGSIGDVMGSLVGESERKMREMLATADAIGRCILRLDEFEKMAAGMESSGRTDAGTTSRVLKDFLTWLNDRKSPVFVVATVNRIDALPAEVLRKGRFDEIFYVDLPTGTERRDIFRIHLKRNRLDPTRFDVGTLAERTAGFSGAEIEQAVISSRYRAFAQKKDVTTQSILDAIAQTKPLSVTMKAQIDAVRERLKDVAVAASSPEIPRGAEAKGGRKLKG